MGASSEVGTRWPAHATSTGKVLLAAARGSGEPGRLAHRLRRVTSRTITDPARLERELDRVQERGWAAAVEELETGYVAVGAPILDHAGRALAAISVGGPASRLTARRIPRLARRVVDGARRISVRLGAVA